MTVVANGQPVAWGRVLAGELDPVFSRYGRMIEIALTDAGSIEGKWFECRSVHYGPVVVRHTSGSDHGPDLLDVIWSEPTNPGQHIFAFSATSIDILLMLWGKPISVADLSYPYPGLSHALFHKFEQKDQKLLFWSATFKRMLERLRRAEVKQVIVFTFEDPFLSEEDRLAYLGERM